MIVRILGEGQLQVDDSASAELNSLDAALEKAVNSGDEAAFRFKAIRAGNIVIALQPDRSRGNRCLMPSSSRVRGVHYR